MHSSAVTLWMVKGLHTTRHCGWCSDWYCWCWWYCGYWWWLRMNAKRAVPDTGTSRDHVTFSGQVSHRAKTPLPDSHLVHTDRTVADHDILATSLHLPEVCFTTATTTDGQEYEQAIGDQVFSPLFAHAREHHLVSTVHPQSWLVCELYTWYSGQGHGRQYVEQNQKTNSNRSRSWTKCSTQFCCGWVFDWRIMKGVRVVLTAAVHNLPTNSTPRTRRSTGTRTASRRSSRTSSRSPSLPKVAQEKLKTSFLDLGCFRNLMRWRMSPSNQCTPGPRASPTGISQALRIELREEPYPPGLAAPLQRFVSGQRGTAHWSHQRARQVALSPHAMQRSQPSFLLQFSEPWQARKLVADAVRDHMRNGYRPDEVPPTAPRVTSTRGLFEICAVRQAPLSGYTA